MGRANSSDAAAQEGGESDTGGRTMSVSKGVGIPVKLLHEAEGHIVTVELKTGETFRGTLKNSEDNWNCQLENVTATARDGRVTHLGKAFIRGSKVRYVVAPDMLKNAPIFKRIDPNEGQVPAGPGRDHPRGLWRSWERSRQGQGK